MSFTHLFGNSSQKQPKPQKKTPTSLKTGTARDRRIFPKDTAYPSALSRTNSHFTSTLQIEQVASPGSQTTVLLLEHVAHLASCPSCLGKRNLRQSEGMWHHLARFVCSHQIHLASSAKSRHPPHLVYLWLLMPHDQHQHCGCCTSSCTDSSEQRPCQHVAEPNWILSNKFVKLLFMIVGGGVESGGPI